jgi:5-methylcytosine-specific restriction endonuclease McrA
VHRGRCEQHQLRQLRGWPWCRRVAQAIERDHGICWICGELGADTADHIVRVRDGGDDSLENLRAAHHQPCNTRSRGQRA